MSKAGPPRQPSHPAERPDTAGRAHVGLPVLGAAPSATVAPAAGRRSRVKPARPPVVAFVSLGCAKNLVDSEAMLGRLAESGAVISGDESAADTVVVNTCGFLEAARQEALSIIHDLGERKKRGKLKRIVVAGCLVQRDGEKLRDAAPEIDALVGVNNREDIVQAVWRMDRDAAVDRYLGEYHAQAWDDRGRLRLTPRHYGYVRISEGCNQKCTFCTIPSIRGPMHSKTPDELVREAQELTADGAREILLIGQDTTSYGIDLVAKRDGLIGADLEEFLSYSKPGRIPTDPTLGLAALLRRLDREVVDARWIRLMYVYPTILTDAIIDAIAECERVVKYIDIPLQHINDRMLKRMARRVTRAQTEKLLEKLRRRIPGVAIRTTFIVGFPGETEAEFSELVDFVRGFGFDAAGAFEYSLEPETPAGRMPEQLDPAIKAERRGRLMEAQQEVAFAMAKRRVGSRFEVLIDGGRVARHAGQAPDVDAVCLLPKSRRAAGEFIEVECVGTRDYDLICSPVTARRP
jgi:ribosomal protein S12 methylthiotransferase